MDMEKTLNAVAEGTLSVQEALKAMEQATQESLGHTTVDHDRARRCGFPEVIFAERKTSDQVVEIAGAVLERSPFVLITRTPDVTALALKERYEAVDHNSLARTVLIGTPPHPKPEVGLVLVVAAGTSDLPVAEEARITARAMGAQVESLNDVGVAGIHRLLAHTDLLAQASAVVVVAGMEGALPSVVGGLVSVPVVAVPTSVGYGASFGGLAALLGMLNSCASGVSVVNIDNGFGGGTVAARIALAPTRGHR